MYPRVRSAPRLRPLSSIVEHAPQHHSEEPTNYPEATYLHSSIDPPPTFILSPPSYITTSPLSLPVLLSSAPIILSSQSDPSSQSVVGHPTSTIGVSQSNVPSSNISSQILSPSNVTLARGNSQTNMPTVTPTVKHTHVGIIVGSVGGFVAILIGIAVCYCLINTRKGRRRYNNIQSEDERPYLLGPEGDDIWIPYPQIDDLSIHNEQNPQEVDYISLQQQNRQGVQYSYPLADLTPNYRGHNTTISSAGGEDPGFRTGDVEGLIPQQHDAESDSRANDFGERVGGEIPEDLGAHASRASIVSWARTAFGFAAPRVSTGYHPSSSRTTVVDIDQISLPRRLQKWQRPLQPKQGAG